MMPLLAGELEAFDLLGLTCCCGSARVSWTSRPHRIREELRAESADADTGIRVAGYLRWFGLEQEVLYEDRAVDGALGWFVAVFGVLKGDRHCGPLFFILLLLGSIGTW